MKLTFGRLAAVMMVAMALTAGCKKSYDDPKAFAEHYVIENLDKTFGAMYKDCQYKGMELADVKLSVNFLGGQEIHCQVKPVLRKGAKYFAGEYGDYRPEVTRLDWRLTDEGKGRPFIAPGEVAAITSVCAAVAASRPRVVKPLTAEGVAKFIEDGRQIRVSRAKVDGQFIPAAGENGKVFRYFGVEAFFGNPGFLSETIVKKEGMLVEGTPEVAAAQVSYSNRFAAACAKVGRLNKLADELQDVITMREETRYLLGGKTETVTRNAFTDKLVADRMAKEVEPLVSEDRSLEDQLDAKQREMVRTDRRLNGAGNGERRLASQKGQVERYAERIVQLEKELAEQQEERARLAPAPTATEEKSSGFGGFVKGLGQAVVNGLNAPDPQTRRQIDSCDRQIAAIQRSLKDARTWEASARRELDAMEAKQAETERARKEAETAFAAANQELLARRTALQAKIKSLKEAIHADAALKRAEREAELRAELATLAKTFADGLR